MNKKTRISLALIAMFLVAVLAANLALATTSAFKPAGTASIDSKSSANAVSPSNKNPIANDDTSTLTPNNPPVKPTESPAPIVNDLEALKASVAETYEEAEANILPVRTRYLMYTNDGRHIMWGGYGNGHFVGTDNEGKRCWGIYGQGIFAGFYDGEFFWGKYNNGGWKAEYLFGLRYSQGKYVLFPSPAPTTSSTAP